MTDNLAPVPPAGRSETTAWVAVAVICTAYVACIVRLTAFPMQDYGNHLARAVVMADLLFHHGAHYGQLFQVHLVPVPYVLPDLILMSLVEILGVAAGSGVFLSLVLLSLPCALLFYASSCNIAPRARPFVFLIGLYFSLDWFFIAGFMAFRLALALIVVSLAIAEILRRRWSAPVFVAYVVVLVVGYLTHLTAPVFLTAAIGMSALVRLWFGTTTIRREIYLLAPLVLLLAAYFAVLAPSHLHTASEMKHWAGPGGGRPWVRKIRNLLYDFHGFDRHVTTPTMILFAVCMLWPIRREINWRVLLGKPVVVEQLTLVATFLGIYFVLPFESQFVLYVDIRALPMVSILLMLACLRLPTEESVARNFGNVPMLGLAAALAVANLIYIVIPLNSNNTWINHYRAILSSVPENAYVLPVNTETSQQYVVHVASHVVLDRGATYPYLFSGNSGDPMTYFRYKSPRYAPDFQWYRTQLHGAKQAAGSAVDWNRVACDYEYIVVTMPFDATFIRVPTKQVAANDAAALLAVDKAACHAGAPST